MKQICLTCDRSALDRNLYCQEVRCPAERSPLVLESGERVEDIEIVRPLCVLRASALYEARRGGTRVLFKVAHPGARHTERLKREAYLVLGLQRARAHDPALPVLLAPHSDASLAGVVLPEELGGPPPPLKPGDPEPFGRVALRGHLLYYCLFAHFGGEPLRNVLKEQPQLWTKHAAWIAISLASAVALLHSKSVLHLGVCPDAALVRFDPRGGPPQVLLADLGLASSHRAFRTNFYPDFVAPAYTAPELLSASVASPASAADVYGLGLTLYELLEGQPAFPATLSNDAAVADAVRRGALAPMERREDIAPTVRIVEQSVSTVIKDRHESVQLLALELIKLFGRPQPSRSRALPHVGTTLALTIALLTIAFLVALMLSLGDLVGAAGPAVLHTRG